MSVDLENLVKVLQPVAHVPYAPPHVFPMSAPNFQKAPEVERPRPAGDPLGLYLHIPYCRYACNFCFYIKRIGADDTEMQDYVAALEKEVQHVPAGTPLTQLFVGGGTPTALPAKFLDKVLATALNRMDRTGESIHTVECSPETVTDEHLDVLRKHGVQRVSMGVQTFNNDVLRRVHRRHTGEQALDACRKLAASGLMVNIDLMYGLPGQSREIFHDDFAMVASEKVGCVTAYNLRVNEGTPVRRLLKDHERLELSRLAVWRGFVRDTARQLGYEQPHWQRFMLPDTQFELELTSDNLYGLGVSARSFLDNAVYRNHTKLSRYVQRVESGSSPVEEVFPLSLEHQKTYFITRTLGAGKQLDYRIYEERFGRRFWQDYGEVCQPLLDTGALEEDGDRLAISPMGALLYDRVTLAFYPEVLQRWLQGRHEKAMRGRVV